jgi:hypothetical protein
MQERDSSKYRTQLAVYLHGYTRNERAETIKIIFTKKENDYYFFLKIKFSQRNYKKNLIGNFKNKKNFYTNLYFSFL